jgi:hypothetical protein
MRERFSWGGGEGNEAVIQFQWEDGRVKGYLRFLLRLVNPVSETFLLLIGCREGVSFQGLLCSSYIMK